MWILFTQPVFTEYLYYILYYTILYYILYSVLNSRDIILLTKVHRVKTMVFPVVMYGCEWGTIKKAEH